MKHALVSGNHRDFIKVDYVLGLKENLMNFGSKKKFYIHTHTPFSDYYVIQLDINIKTKGENVPIN